METGHGASANEVPFLERTAVGLSLWVGGVGLAAMKCLVYVATGSALVRASMFDSIGDVLSSAIMALTQRRAADSRDLHLYPMGKGRFAALGVLFFCAFMCSTMSSMVLESVQALFAADEEPSAADALRRLFEEKPRLRWAYGPRRVEAMIAEYGDGGGDGGRACVDGLSTALLAACVGVKVLLYVWCKGVAQQRGSDIVAALATDHRNDTITNAMVIATMLGLRACRGGAWDGPWVARVDPAVSLLLSIWIVRGWLASAADQFRLLSDRRVEGADAEAIRAAAGRALEGGPWELRGSDVYHSGDGYRVHLELLPSADAAAERAAACFQALERAVRGASGEVRRVDVRLRPRGAGPKPEPAWVAEYRA